MTFAVTNTFTANTLAQASQVNANFTDIENELNAFPTDGAFKSGGITAAAIASSAVTTAKIADNAVTTDKILDAAVTGDKVATGADGITADNIVDGTITNNKLAAGSCFVSDGTEVFDATSSTSYTDLDLSSYVGSNAALVYLKVKQTGTTVYNVYMRTNGDTDSASESTIDPYGCNSGRVRQDEFVNLVLVTDSNGIIEWRTSTAAATVITLVGYII